MVGKLQRIAKLKKSVFFRKSIISPLWVIEIVLHLEMPLHAQTSPPHLTQVMLIYNQIFSRAFLALNFAQFWEISLAIAKLRLS
jgi:hypothetical protein